MPLPLEAFQTRLEDVPLGPIDHHGQPGVSGSVAIGFGNVVIAFTPVEQVRVHVHVEHVRAAPDLVGRDDLRGLVVTRPDQLAETAPSP